MAAHRRLLLCLLLLTPTQSQTVLGATSGGGGHERKTYIFRVDHHQVAIVHGPPRPPRPLLLDTGVWPERRSLSDWNLPPVPARWRGGCDAGPAFPASSCNRKLVGARFFSQGHAAHYGSAAAAKTSNGSVEYMSPRDADGHGTHTATTAARRRTRDAHRHHGGWQRGLRRHHGGVRLAKGVAPKARVAVYKVCWKGAGCLDSHILAGFNRAVADGVDVIPSP